MGKHSSNGGLTANDIDCYEIITPSRVEKMVNPNEEDNNNTYWELECGDCVCFQRAHQTPSFADLHILYSDDYLQMAKKIYTPQDTFVISHSRSLYNNKELSDVTIKIDDSTFYLNKCVLSCIPYFKAMMFGNMKESYQSEVVLKDVSAKGMEALLKYIYKIEDWCPEDDMQALLDMLQLIDIHNPLMQTQVLFSASRYVWHR